MQTDDVQRWVQPPLTRSWTRRGSGIASTLGAMRPAIEIGERAETVVTVDASMCPAFDGVVVHEVYSTWSMAHHMEIAARKVLAPHLEPDEEGIGAHLSIDHVAPTPLGHRVRVIAEAVEVGPTTLVCDVTAYHVRPGQSAESTPLGELTVVGRGRQVQRVLPRSTLETIIRRAARPGTHSSERGTST